nr:MAG TPA: hypothetical protein [Caudoviricetes sp.]
MGSKSSLVFKPHISPSASSYGLFMGGYLTN